MLLFFFVKYQLTLMCKSSKPVNSTFCKVFNVFHTVCIVLYVRCTDLVIEASLYAFIKLKSTVRISNMLSILH